jgi:hypothetical protein
LLGSDVPSTHDFDMVLGHGYVAGDIFVRMIQADLVSLDEEERWSCLAITTEFTRSTEIQQFVYRKLTQKIIDDL